MMQFSAHRNPAIDIVNAAKWCAGIVVAGTIAGFFWKQILMWLFFGLLYLFQSMGG